jgi:hypothetical protein
MKVLDLQCQQAHSFEGWFGSEDDFQSQLARGLVQCPLCGDASVVKKLSAPRLNLISTRGAGHASAGSDGQSSQHLDSQDQGSATKDNVNRNSANQRSENRAVAHANSSSVPAAQSGSSGTNAQHPAMQAMLQDPQFQAAYLHMARSILANTEDVGTQFAQEARKMHYGETDERAIRGQATRDETLGLLDEGIDVLPLPLPDALKGPVH